MRKLQDVECEATEATKSSRRYGSKRRTRAAEVHNLSERVRSDSTDVHNKAMHSLLVGCSYIIVDFC
jgi:phytochrome-interacting factor 4